MVGEALAVMCVMEDLWLLEHVDGDRGKPIETLDEVGLPSLDGSIAEYQIVLGNRYARARFVDFETGKLEILSMKGEMPFPRHDPRTSSTFRNLQRETSAGRHGQWRMTPISRGTRIEFVCTVDLQSVQQGTLTGVVTECIAKTDEFIEFLRR